MRTSQGCILTAAVALLTVSGCGLISPDTVTVNLVNNGDFAIEVQIFTHDDQNVLETFIDNVGSEINLSVPAGQTVSFTRECDALQALIVADADLQILGGLLGPEAGTRVFRDGSDFNCGDTITLTFSHPDLAISLNIDFNAGSILDLATGG